MKMKTASAGLPAYVRLLLAGGALGAFAVATPAFAAATPAGTEIKNKATATYDNPDPEDETPVEVDSNETTLLVDEILDVAVDWVDTSNIGVDSPDEDRVLEFTVTNAGNGSEAFALTALAATGDFDPTNIRIYIDTAGGDMGQWDASDTLYTSAVTIGAEDNATVFVVSDIPGSLVEENLGNVTLRAVATTKTNASDPTGEIYAGEGTGGGDAVVGSTTANAFDQGTYEIGYVTPPPTPISVDLDKEQDVEDRFGGSLAIPGSTVTYTLVATVAGDGTANNLVITDPIPSGVTYEPGTLKLKIGSGTTATLTDIADSDNGQVAGGEVEVDLGNAAANTYTISFEVVIDEE